MRKHKVQSNLARNAERLERDPRLLLLPLLQPMPPRLLCFHDNEPPSINHRPREDRFRVGRGEWNFLAASLMAPPLGFLRPPPGHFTPQNSPPRGRNGNGSERYHAKRIVAIHAARIAFRSRCVCRHFLALSTFRLASETMDYESFSDSLVGKCCGNFFGFRCLAELS